MFIAASYLVSVLNSRVWVGVLPNMESSREAAFKLDMGCGSKHEVSLKEWVSQLSNMVTRINILPEFGGTEYFLSTYQEQEKRDA